MMSRHFVNKDAEFLHELSQKESFGPEDFALLSRLKIIAEHLQSLDDKSTSAYSRGFTDGKNSHLARSNVTKPEGSRVFPNLRAAIADFKGEVQVVPPVSKKEMASELTLDDLDLEDDE